MKSETPQISWHNREEILSVDVQFYDEKCKNDSLRYRIATASIDHHVLLWLSSRTTLNSKFETEVLADLNRHAKPVNIVRFSPNFGYLASGDDDGIIIIWKLQDCVELESKDTHEDAIDSYGVVNKEHWIQHKILRGHLEDVVDLSWSFDGLHLISGSVDNRAFVWEVCNGKSSSLDGHKSYVQGVCSDPLNNLILTLSADRRLRVFNTSTKRTMFRVYRDSIKIDDVSKVTRLFYDDTLRSYCRRICFSPGGEFFLASSGIVEIANDDKEVKFINCCYLFLRNSINKPAAYFSTGDKFNFAVSCCPVRFQLRENVSNPFPFPYRIVFAVATRDAVLFFDTQQDIPFAFVSNIHYTSLSDIRWSPDGSLLFVSSKDGYCTFISFDEDEIGVRYDGPVYTFKTMNVNSPNSSESVKVSSTPENVKTPDSAKITRFFTKIVPKKSGDETTSGRQSGCKRKGRIEVLGSDTTPKKKHPLPTSNLKSLFIPLERISLDDIKLHSGIITNNPENNETSIIEQPVNCVTENVNNGVEMTYEVKAPIDSIAKKPRRVSFITLTTPK